MKIRILLLQLMLFLAGNVAPVRAKFVGNIKDDDDGGTITILDIQDDNKTQYLNQNFEQGNYNYGYDIKPSGPVGQFHHETKSPDEVVYGCYGYEGSDSRNHMTFYVSDAWGYRPVTQESDIEIFYPADNPEGTGHMNGKLTRWADLIFPEQCAQFAERIASSTNVVTKEPLRLASPPASIVPSFKTTAVPIGSSGAPLTPSLAGLTPSGPTSTRSTFAQTPVPSGSFDVIQFNTPTGTSATPFSRLITSSNTERPTRLSVNNGNRGTTTPQQPPIPQSGNLPSETKSNQNIPNRFASTPTGTSGTVPASSTTGINRNRPSPFTNTFGTTPGGLNSGIDNGLRGTGTPVPGNNGFTQNVPVSPDNAPNSNSGTSTGSSTFRNPLPSSGTGNNINQTPSTRQPLSNAPSSLGGRTTPTAGSSGRPTTTSGFNGRDTPTSGFTGRPTPTSGFSSRPTPTSTSGFPAQSTRPHSATRGSTNNNAGSNAPVSEESDITQTGFSPSGPTNSFGNTGFPSTPFTGFNSRVTSGNIQQAASPLNSNNNLRATTRPASPSSLTETGKTTSQFPSSSNANRGTGSTVPAGTRGTSFGNTQLPSGSRNNNGNQNPNSRTSTAGPSRPHTFANPYDNDNDEDVSVNVVDNTSRNPTSGSKHQNPGGAIGSQFPTTPINKAGTNKAPFSSRTNSPTDNTAFTPSSTNGGGRRTTTTPALSNSQGSTTFLLPNNPSSSEGTTSSRNPNGNTQTNRPSSSSPNGNTRTPGNDRFSTSNTPSTSSPFPRHSSSFVNNPSTLQPSSTNQNTIPTGTTSSDRRFGSSAGSSTSLNPTKQPGSGTNNFRGSTRINEGSSTPFIPEEPDTETGIPSQQPGSPFSTSAGGGTSNRNGFGQGSTQGLTQPTLENRPTSQIPFGSRHPTTSSSQPTRSPTTLSATTGFRQPSRNTAPARNSSSPGNQHSQESFCETQCSSCNTNTNKEPTPDEIYSQIPGAILSNIPVIFYPDCGANAYSRPAIVPFCPSQKSQCDNQAQPLTMKFPDTSNFIFGHSNAPVARNAFGSGDARKARRGRQPRTIKV